MNRRRLILLGVGLPATGLFALLVWGLADSGRNPGSLGINSQLGEVLVDNKPVPPFRVESLTGVWIDSEALRGKVVMIDFWSSWCGPCRVEAPLLSHVYQEYQGQSVEFVGIAIWDNENDVRAFVDEFNIAYSNAIDPKGRLAFEYGVTGVPQKFFIDKSGNLAKKYIGPMNAESLRQIIDDILSESAQESAYAR